MMEAMRASHKAQQMSDFRLPRNISVEPITTVTLPAYRRLITLLLPIRYPDKFYKESVSNPTQSTLALCALWQEAPQRGKAALEPPNGQSFPILKTLNSTPIQPNGLVVGGIQCRLEPLPSPPTSMRPQQQLYIQTLAVLAPYRQLGIAAALLEVIVATAVTQYDSVTQIYAHVWQENVDALEWYEKRGFIVETGIVEGYYRKLKPGGAKVVRRSIGVSDHLRTLGDRGKDEPVLIAKNVNIPGEKEDEVVET